MLRYFKILRRPLLSIIRYQQARTNITEPREDYKSVVPCLTKVTGEMNEICTVILADIVLKTKRDQELDSVSELSKSLF